MHAVAPNFDEEPARPSFIQREPGQEQMELEREQREIERELLSAKLHYPSSQGLSKWKQNEIASQEGVQRSRPKREADGMPWSPNAAATSKDGGHRLLEGVGQTNIAVANQRGGDSHAADHAADDDAAGHADDGDDDDTFTIGGGDDKP